MAIEIKKGIRVNEESVSFQAVRSSGPGGQHVNKSNTKVLLICPVDSISGLSDKQVGLIKNKLNSYIVDNELRVSCQKHRSQYANKLEAVAKLQALLQKALKEKKPRYKTKVPRSVKEKRLKEKRMRSEIKKNRKFNPADDE